MNSTDSNFLGSYYDFVQPYFASNNSITVYDLQSAARNLYGTKRLLTCSTNPLKWTSLIEVRRNKGGRLFYWRVSRCGCAWVCPVCATASNRCHGYQIHSAIQQWVALEKSVHLVTLTVPHFADDNLQQSLDQLQVAHRTLLNRRPWKRFCQKLGCVGAINALEINHGPQGWNPHYHLLIFVENCKSKNGSETALALAEEHLEVVRESWRDCCRAAGLELPRPEYGLTVVDGTGAGYYLTKAIHNLSPSRKRENRTPWNLLYDYHVYQDRAAGQLFQEYAVATVGRHQVSWSRGLRRRFGVEKGTRLDRDKDTEVLGAIETPDWLLVVQYQRRGDVLEAARAGGWAAVEELLHGLRLQAKEHKEKQLVAGKLANKANSDPPPVPPVNEVAAEPEVLPAAPTYESIDDSHEIFYREERFRSSRFMRFPRMVLRLRPKRNLLLATSRGPPRKRRRMIIWTYQNPKIHFLCSW